MKNKLLKLQNYFIKKQLAQANLQLGFAMIRLASLNKKCLTFSSPQEKQEFTYSFQKQTQIPFAEQVELQNKALYLQYMQSVLLKKQQELIKFQDQLKDQDRFRNEEKQQKLFMKPVRVLYGAEMYLKKLEANKQFINKLSTIVHTKYIKESNNEIHEAHLLRLKLIENQYQQIMITFQQNLQSQFQAFQIEKQQLSSKLSKLSELECYEKYLNDLQQLLEKKEEDIINKNREKALLNKGFFKSNKAQTVNNDDHSMKNDEDSLNKNILYDSVQNIQQESLPNHNNTSIRKRTKIFDTNKTYLSDETFGHNNPSNSHKQSSKVMQENSTNDQLQSNLQFHKQYNSIQEQQPNVASSKSFNRKNTTSSQTTFQTKHQVISKLANQKIYVKFVNLWLSFSIKKSKSNNPNYLKSMGLYKWRVNSLYDGSCYSKIVNNLQNLNQHDSINLWSTKLINYEELSLKKKKYFEQFFDFQYNKFIRNKRKLYLKIVCKNKNIKERLAVLLLFKKFRTNSKIQSTLKNFNASLRNTQNLQNIFVTLNENSTKNQSMFQQNYQQMKSKSTLNKNAIESRISVSSSLIMNENSNRADMEGGLRKSKSKGRQLKESKVIYNSSGNIMIDKYKPYQKNSAKDHQAIGLDSKKLKQYIRSQEQAEANLAIKCSQIQSTFKISNVITPIIHRQMSSFLLNFCKIDETRRLNVLQKNYNACEFKWELFMTKLRLAQANTTNKIGHLQQLLGFITGEK